MDTASPIKQLTVFPVEINKYLIELETSTENAPQNGDMILGHSLLSCILQDSIDYITQKGYEKQPIDTDHGEFPTLSASPAPDWRVLQMFQSSAGDSTRVCLLADTAWPEGNAISAAEDECIRQTTNNRLKYGRRNPPDAIYTTVLSASGVTMRVVYGKRVKNGDLYVRISDPVDLARSTDLTKTVQTLVVSSVELPDLMRDEPVS
ncbi:hypothetical protein F4824DRAFT_470490 [Ustulina deusta]|nr:hypothetical protein F4824DRAFT_470490 [Ustulina deusta]